uniref:Heparan sulfate 2-O-sulfotransferase 1 n=1 Tax=Salarias fasciatus TaxID=181472 RepID=A0A672GRQ2_SALFA
RRFINNNLPAKFVTISKQSVLLKPEVAETERRVGEDQPPPARGDNTVIIYNRVPQTASTSFTNIAYDLCRKNQFHVLHVNTSPNNPVLSLQDQVSEQDKQDSSSHTRPGSSLSRCCC